MNNIDNILILLILILTLILLLLRIIVYRSSASASYLMKRRWKNINWNKVFKYWFIFQVVIVLSKLDKLSSNIFFITAAPLVFILFLLLSSLSIEKLPPHEKDILDQEEFEDYEKSFNRQKKIDKLL